MTFRPPIIITIYPRPKAAEPYYNVRISPLLTPNPAQPFFQTDWPRPALPGKVQASDAPANLYPWQHPNPSKPFHQDDWSQLATPSRPKAAEPYYNAVISPLLTPNPSRPFHQDDWLRAFPYPKAKVDDFVNLLPVQTGVVVVFPPIHQPLWENAALSYPKAKVDDFVNVLPLNAFQPIHQPLWENATLSRPKITDTSGAPPSPLLTPNPPVPFSQELWEGEPVKPKAKVDDFVNLAPIQSTIVVVFPFSLSDWPRATLPQPKIIDTSLAASAPLYTPNPAAPFTSWDIAVLDRLPTVESDIFVNPLPLQYPPAVQAPFIQGDWPSAILGRQKIGADSYGTDLPIYLPGTPFTLGQDDWPIPVLGRQKIHAESFGIDLPLKFPNPTRPFQQSDWASATKGFPAAGGHFYPINPNLQPPPIIIPAKPDNLHFLADVGRLMSR